MNLFHYFVIIAVFFNRFSTSAEIDSRHNVFCEAIPKVVAVEADGLPYYVTLNRCQGSIHGHNPMKKECVELTSDTVEVIVTNDLGKKKLIEMKNHTQCTGKCLFDDKTCNPTHFNRNENDCSCTCKYQTSPPDVKINRDKQRWNPISCSVDCLLTTPAPIGKRLDKEKCQFVCKKSEKDCVKEYGKNLYLDTEHCICKIKATQTGASTGKKENDCDVISTSVIVAVVEFCILFFIFECYMYRHRAGLTYNMKKACLQSKNKVTKTRMSDKNSSDASDAPLTVYVDKNGTTTSKNHQNVSAI